jgi:tricorn protease-like protein
MTRVPLAAAMRSLPVPRRYYVDPIVSPNGRFVAVEDLGGADDIWVIDLETGAPQRLTFNAGEDETPVWSPDGLWVAYASDRPEGRQILRRRADGGGAEERVWSGAAHLHVEDWTPDGRYLITSGVEEEGLGLLDLHASPPTLRAFMPAQRGVTMARLSADGRWIAYAAGEAGSDEIYVQDFPQLSARWQVTQGGGVNPMWAADGRALFYRRGETLFRAPVQTAASALSFSAAVPIFKVLPGVKGNHRPWAVMPNGDALVLENKSGDQGAYLNVFLNWAATLFERPR